MNSEQRKLQNTLSISGLALIAFCALDVLKFVLYWFLNQNQYEIIKSLFDEAPNAATILLLILFGYILLEILFSVFVGLFARSEGKGKKRNIFYIIVAIFMAVYLLGSGIFTIVYCFLDTITFDSIFDSFISAIVDFTVVFVLIEIITSSLKLRKKAKKGGEK